MPAFGDLLIVVPRGLGRAAHGGGRDPPVDAAESAALIGAGLLSVLIFPVTGRSLLRRATPEPA